MQKYHIYKERGNVGLVNLGNTCFLNSCLQIMNHSFELIETFKNPKVYAHIKSDVNEFVILKEWTSLFETMWSDNPPGAVSPNRFVFAVHFIAKHNGRELFTGWAQNDLSEFLQFIIESLHKILARPVNLNIKGFVKNKRDLLAMECYKMMKTEYAKEYSEIMQMFNGVLVSKLIHPTSNEVLKINPEFFFILDLPIPTNMTYITLQDCINLYIKPELLENDNAWINDKQEKMSVLKSLSFWSLPEILVISLQRFSNDGTHKRNDNIHFPISGLDMSSYVEGYDSTGYNYDLYGICNHIGNVDGGHYTAFVKNANEQWVHFNDSSVGIVSPNQLITPMAYCLFYRKMSKESKVQEKNK